LCRAVVHIKNALGWVVTRIGVGIQHLKRLMISIAPLRIM
jgi:hypothetical protein